MNTHELCVAPMMRYTDRHCRYFHRLLSPHARLFTEMVHAEALVNGSSQKRLLDFHLHEQPLVLQLGGNRPHLLAQAAKMGESWGYQEINLNCGCPSPRVQSGAFGACLMRDPKRTAQLTAAIIDAVSIPVSVKHRIGLDQVESFDFLVDFVGHVADTGVKTFMVHARNAWLNGINPKQNRHVPVLRYQWVHQLKQQFPSLNIVINGGIDKTQQVLEQLNFVDGVMLGRAAYSNPWLLHELEHTLFHNSFAQMLTREQVFVAMQTYAKTLDQVPTWSIFRHMQGLYRGQAGAKNWRRQLCERVQVV